MSKLSRSVIKEIVKECIVEIFAESFFNDDNKLMKENKRYRNNSGNNSSKYDNLNDRSLKSQRPRTSNHENTRSQHLDNIAYNNEDIRVNEAYDNKINRITSKMTNDPVMANIFKDTAATTLQQQIGAESSKGVSILAGGDAAAKKAYNSDPTELFSESANKWAQLAFADSIKK